MLEKEGRVISGKMRGTTLERIGKQTTKSIMNTYYIVSTVCHDAFTDPICPF